MTPKGTESSRVRTRRRGESRQLAGRNDLPGIEYVLRIERALERAHGVERLGAEFGFEVFLLALADAVLAGAGAVHRLRALHQAMHELLPARHLLAIVDVAGHRAMKVAVTDMADDRRDQLEPLQILLGFADAV